MATISASSSFPYVAPGASAPLPPTGAFLEAVKSSSRAAITSDPDILLADDDATIDAFINAIEPSKWESLVSSADPLRVPLRFDDVLAEMNYIALRGYLNIGSGYRKELKSATGRGAAETITFGMLSLFISQTAPTAEWMAGLTRSDVSELFGLQYQQEKAHPTITGIYLMERTELAGLLDLLYDLLTDCGRTLMQKNHRSLAHFILDVSKAPAGERPKANRLVEALVTTFRGLRDAALWRDKPIFVFKKAQLIAADCWRAFRNKAPANFAFDDVDQLSVFADNVLPACLISLGLIKVSGDIATLIEEQTDLGLPPAVSSQIDSRLRAAAIAICDHIVDRARERGKEMTAADLDYYLWSLGKEAAYRGLKRPVNKQTLYY